MSWPLYHTPLSAAFLAAFPHPPLPLSKTTPTWEVSLKIFWLKTEIWQDPAFCSVLGIKSGRLTWPKTCLPLILASHLFFSSSNTPRYFFFYFRPLITLHHLSQLLLPQLFSGLTSAPSLQIALCHLRERGPPNPSSKNHVWRPWTPSLAHCGCSVHMCWINSWALTSSQKL